MTGLDVLKTRFSPMSLRLIMDDPIALDIIAAWPLVGVTCEPKPVRGNPREAADKTWDTAVFSCQRITELTGILPEYVKDRIPKLRALGVVYPDGTVAPQAQALISAEVSARVRELSTGRKAKENGAKGNV